MPNTPVQAAGEAMPKTTWNASMDFNRHSLKRLSIKELATFGDAITHAREAVNGVNNQPRCTDKVDQQLDRLQDFLNETLEMVNQIAREFVPKDRSEASERAYIIIRQETFFADDFAALEAAFNALEADMAPFVKGDPA